MDNQTLAAHLRRHARVLDAEGGNLYRVRAYRRAADLLLDLEEPVARLLGFGGRRALRQLPGIGSHIARSMENLILTGEIPVREDVSVT